MGANATILPNVKIGDNSIIGANSVVTKDIPANCVAAGNPVKIICSLEEFLNRNQEKMETAQKFGREYRFSKKITEEKKEEMKCAVKNGMAYID